MVVDLSAISLILEAGFIVQIVMGILLLMSVHSWTLIFRKSRELRYARKAANNFEKHFWKGRDLHSLYTHITDYEYKAYGLEKIFEAGYNSFNRLCKSNTRCLSNGDVVQGVQRAMQARLQRETDMLEYGLSTLATIGSVSPYIGLFGTVWGIMDSFQALSNVQQATIAMVAPGISEALIATAMGLFAAIPAVIAYNNYINNVDRIINRYDIFADEFTSILQRQAHQLEQRQEQKKTPRNPQVDTPLTGQSI